MRIGIIGAGNIGSILTRHLRQLEHEVLIANSRGPETLNQFANEIGARAVTAPEAASGVDLLVLTIPFERSAIAAQRPARSAFEGIANHRHR